MGIGNSFLHRHDLQDSARDNRHLIPRLKAVQFKELLGQSNKMRSSRK
jgi:hypothetical protein